MDDCGVDRVGCDTLEELWNEDDYDLLPADQYECAEGPVGSGMACMYCELRFAWWQLERAEAALDGAGIPRPYPERLTPPVTPTN